MKKLLLFLLTILLSTVASAWDACIDGIYYNFDQTAKTATVAYNSSGSYNQYCYSGTVNIPATVDYNGETYSVTSIGAHAFHDYSGLSAVTIPNNVTGIGQYAFSETGWYNSQQNWWGYISANDIASGVGVSAADTYHCAIFIPGDHDIAAGKTINAIRFGLVAPHATNAKVWVASSLPSSIDASHTLQYVDVPASALGNEQIDIQLPTPCEIPASGIYVGYSFTITSATTSNDAYPVLFGGEPAINTLILKTEKNVPDWSDLYSNGFGRLFLQVLLEGTFAENNATVAEFGPVYSVLGESTTAMIALTNGGGTPLSSIDYTITTDGVTGAEQHADIANPIAFSNTGKVKITIAADETIGQKVKTLNITKVNGNANTAEDASANFTLYTLPELVERNIVVEEFTGTGCGYCPRGLVGMEKMRQAFGNRFIGIGIHQYNSSDAMYISPSGYAKLNFEGAPSCRINRGEIIDPYYGSGYDILVDCVEELAIPALAKVNVSATIDEELKKVDAKAEVETLLDNSEYTLEFVVIGDGLTGTGSGWNQSNYYYQYSASELPEDLAIFANGGKYGKSSVTGWLFNDVALVSSYVSGSNNAPALGTLAAGEAKEMEYTLTMPTKTTLKNAVKNAELYIVALLVDQSGSIVNAAKQQITVPAKGQYRLIYMVDDQTYKTISYDYGDAITPEPAPVREGYTFSGWSEIPETMPAHDVTVTGTFSINKYKLTYTVDGEVYKTYEIEYGTTITPETEPSKKGYTFSGWSNIPETMPAHDVTVTGSFSINKYKLTYTVDGEVYKTYDIEYGTTIIPEAEPTKEGYTFSGWSEIPEIMPAHDVTITGTFSINKYKLTYTVDAEVYKTYDIEYGATITPEAEPTKEGYTFSGWSEIDLHR